MLILNCRAIRCRITEQSDGVNMVILIFIAYLFCFDVFQMGGIPKCVNRVTSGAKPRVWERRGRSSAACFTLTEAVGGEKTPHAAGGPHPVQRQQCEI